MFPVLECLRIPRVEVTTAHLFANFDDKLVQVLLLCLQIIVRGFHGGHLCAKALDDIFLVCELKPMLKDIFLGVIQLPLQLIDKSISFSNVMVEAVFLSD